MGRGGNAETASVSADCCKLCGSVAEIQCVMCLRVGTAASCSSFCSNNCFIRHFSEHREVPKTPSPPKQRFGRPQMVTSHTPPAPDKHASHSRLSPVSPYHGYNKCHMQNYQHNTRSSQFRPVSSRHVEVHASNKRA